MHVNLKRTAQNLSTLFMALNSNIAHLKLHKQQCQPGAETTSNFEKGRLSFDGIGLV